MRQFPKNATNGQSPVAPPSWEARRGSERCTPSYDAKTVRQEVGQIVRSAIAVKQIAEDFVERGLGLFEFLQCGIECL